MTNLLLQLLELTVSMSLLIAFILLFFKLFGKKFTAKCKYIVWTIVILRLCLPVGILSITPIFEIKVPSVQSTGVNTPNSGAKGDTTPDVPQAGAAATSPDINVQSPTVTPNVIPDITPNPTPTQSAPDTPALPSDIVTKNDSNNASENIHHGAQASENEVQKNAFSLSADMIPILICTVWLVGVLIFIGARLIPYAIYVLRMNKDGLLHTPSEEVETIYKALCLKLGVKRPPKLLVSRVPVSPHLCGFIRRKIIIPDMTYAMNDIESILSHELTHFKRGDLYVKLACTAAQAVSWFNPLVHLASGKCISEMELSCDESVLKNSNEEERILYGNAMLDIVRRCGLVKGSYLTSDFRPKRGAVKERIMNIINSEKKKKGLGIIAAALALCITAGTVIGCTVSAKESEKKENDTKVTETEAPVTDAPETDIPTWKQESLERRQEMHDFAEAFVKRDISKCAEIHRKYYYHSEDQSAAEERFAPLATLEFSKYDIEDVNGDSEYNDSIKMTFTISSSGYDAFPVGDYEGSLSIGPEGIYWKLQKPDDIALTEEEQASVDFITPFFPYMSTDDEESAHRGMTLGIFRELEKISDDPSLEVRATLDEIQEAAFELYSIDGFEPHESESRLLDDGYYTLPGKCGDVSFQRIKNITKADDFYFIDVQYFDEPIYFTPANTVRYAVAETDTRFGYRLQAAEVIDGFKEEASPIFLPYQLQAYEGVWRIDNREDTTLTINKVNTETGFASLRFSFVLSRSFSINTTAGLISGYYYFNDTENSGIQGRIRFYEKEIILIFDSFGSLPGYVGGWGSVYRFNTPENN